MLLYMSTGSIGNQTDHIFWTLLLTDERERTTLCTESHGHEETFEDSKLLTI
jgi:hypothetical protein